MKTWKIEDASQIAKENPTTFYIPPSEEIDSLSPGNIVKLIFCPTNHAEHVCERMWVGIESANEGIFRGRLMNIPGMQGLEYGDLIEFEGKDIIDIDADSLDRSVEYLKRCLVSKRILEDGEMPHYISWITPENNIDSGWLILSGDEDEDYLNQDNNLIHIPLCMMVDHDDSFKHLLDLQKETAYQWHEGEEEQSWVEIDDN